MRRPGQGVAYEIMRANGLTRAWQSAEKGWGFSTCNPIKVSSFIIMAASTRRPAASIAIAAGMLLGIRLQASGSFHQQRPTCRLMGLSNLQLWAQTNSNSQCKCRGWGNRHVWPTSANQGSTIRELDCDSSPKSFMGKMHAILP
uniref:Uncharacterized protein n=1 Tax=Leersia perrieri TaxID=77586 RepID=A0A0D9WLF1_9ORYZ